MDADCGEPGTRADPIAEGAPRFTRRGLLLGGGAVLGQFSLLTSAHEAAGAPASAGSAPGSQPALGSSAAEIYARENLIRWSPNGRYLLTNRGVYALRGERVAPELAYSPRRTPFAGCDWAPDGNRVVLARTRTAERGIQDIVLSPLRKFSPTVLVGRDAGGIHLAPAWEPAGDHVCFLSYQDRNEAAGNPFLRQRLAVKNVKTQEVRVLIDGGVQREWPLWAPGGKQVLVSVLSDPTDRSSAARTFLFDVRSGARREIQLPALYDYEAEHATWVPGTSSLVFAASPHDAGLLTELVLWNSATGKVTSLISGRNRDFPPVLRQPAASPDGRRIVFVRNSRHDIDELVLLTLATRKLRTLHSAPKATSLRSPAWSPDGKSLAFWQERYSVGKLHLLQIDRPKSARSLG